jgi:tetratricopeptide (TPR) repeat protein
MYYLYTGQIEAAEGNFRLALSKARNCYVFYYLGICLERLNQRPEAINYILESWRRDPSYLPALIKLGDLYTQESDFSKAKEYYGAALELDPDNRAIQEKLINQ